VNRSSAAGPAATRVLRVEIGPFRAWQLGMAAELVLLRTLMPDDIRVDFSPGSLADVESELLGHFYEPGDLEADHEQDLVSAAVRYVGEILLDIGGGEWEWDPEATPEAARPRVRLDVDPTPLVPFDVLVEVAAEGTAEVLSDALDDVRRAVRDRIAREPGWRPRKTPTEGLDPVIPADETAAAEHWATERGERFTPGAVGVGDFSPESLDALERMVRLGEDDRELSEWYLGEVFRCAAGGRWRVTGGRALVVRAAGEIKEHEITMAPATILAGLPQQPPGALRTALTDYTG
jgi:hypothetical protein